MIANHDKRVSQDKDFLYLREDMAELNTLLKNNLISLNEADRRKEREIRDARDKLREKNKSYNESGKTLTKARSRALQDDGMQAGERNIKADLAIENANKNTKDILLNEAVHILSDEAELLNKSTKVATSILP